MSDTSYLNNRIVSRTAQIDGLKRASGKGFYNNPGLWHFRFNGPTPEEWVQGRERIYFI
jgi:hypothetical protein